MGRLVGVATTTQIRGLGVVIPANIAFKTVASVLQHGRLKRGYLGIAGQRVILADGQRADDNERQTVLLVVSVGRDTPAAAGGVLVGDLVLTFDGHPVEAPEDLLELLIGDRVGKSVLLGLLRGGQRMELAVTVGDRPVR